MDRMEAQLREFDSLNKLAKAYRNLPAIVDDDYPEMRHYYESAVRGFIDACNDNGRLASLAPPAPAPESEAVRLLRDLQKFSPLNKAYDPMPNQPLWLHNGAKELRARIDTYLATLAQSQAHGEPEKVK